MYEDSDRDKMQKYLHMSKYFRTFAAEKILNRKKHNLI